MPGWVRERATEHTRGAGVDPAMRDGYIEGAEEGARHAAMETNEREDSVAAVALETHRFLVSVDARVSYSARRDKALFESDADLERVNRLDRRLRAAAAALRRAEREDKKRVIQELDSLAVYLQ
jgi:hypothetical protein